MPKAMKNTFKIILLCFGFIVCLLPLACAEVTITLKELDCHFFASEAIPRTLIIHNNVANTQICQLVWTTSVMSAAVQQGKKEVVLAAQEKKEVDIVLAMPQAESRVALEWQIIVSPQAEPPQKLSFSYEVFPRQSLTGVQRIFDKKKVGIYDPVGKIEGLFKQENIRYASIKNSLSLEAFQGDLLLIANNAVTEKNEPFFSVLLDKVYKGISVIFLEQEAMPVQSAFPALHKDGSATKTRCLALGHPLFDNVRQGDLQNWRGDGVIARPLLEKPHKGNFLVLADALDEKGQDLKGALILEISHGKGRLVFSQLLIMEKFDSEPVAGILFENMIRYALRERKTHERVALFGYEENRNYKFFKELGVLAVENPRAIEQLSTIILTQQEDFESRMININKDFFVAMNHFIQRGGRLIIFGITPDMYNNLREIIPHEIGIAEKEIDEPLSFKKDNPVFWGITEEDLSRCRFFKHSVRFEETPDSRLLLSSGKMVLFQSGKGEIIVCQLDFRGDDNDDSNAFNSRVASQLLSNLGVAIVADTFEKKY